VNLSLKNYLRYAEAALVSLVFLVWSGVRRCFTAVADPMVRARFQREAQTAAGLDHPNVCPIYDAVSTRKAGT
jgi:hypothetical protein